MAYITTTDAAAETLQLNQLYFLLPLHFQKTAWRTKFQKTARYFH